MHRSEFSANIAMQTARPGACTGRNFAKPGFGLARRAVRPSVLRRLFSLFAGA
jgi:hypothetical protein